MKKKILPLLFLLPLLALVAADDLKPAEKEDGFKSLFNGKDLTGWDGDSTFWRAEDGMIVGETSAEKPIKNGNTFLIAQVDNADATFGDFEFRVSFQFAADRPFGNSGIQYRSTHIDNGKSPNKWVVGGYQADCDLTNGYTGICYEERGKRGIMVPRGKKLHYSGDANKIEKEDLGETEPADQIKAALKPAGEWNDYVVICRGNHCVQILNGHVTADFVDDTKDLAKSAGVLALQIHAGPPMKISFKNSRIKTTGEAAK
jgi:hypothetical protein